MKKNLLISYILCVSVLHGAGQIVITSTDMPTPTKMFIKASDTMPTISIGNSDTVQTWDMTSLVQHTIDTSFVMPYNNHPDPAFSPANTVMQNQGFYGYLINSSLSYELIGGNGIIDIQGNSTPVSQAYIPAEILFNFPTSFDSSFINNYSTDAKFYFGHQIQGFNIDSIHRKTSVNKTVLADAWGTLTTPLGGTYNVLRIKEVKEIHDTIQAYFLWSWNDIPGGITYSQTVKYRWWANNIGTELATATVDTNGSVLNVEWLTELPSDPPLTAAIASTQVSCEGQCDGTATVAVSWGTPPYSYSWNSYPVQTTASATDLCAGTYTLTVTDSLLATTTATVTIEAPEQPGISASGTTLNASSGGSYQWYLNDTLIPGAAAMTYTVTQNGNYTVFITNNGCTDTSAVYNFNSIGITENVVSNTTIIYPNPANNKVTIAFNSSPGSSLLIEIKNELGQLVKKAELTQLNTDKKVSIDISQLPTGIYFVCIQNNNAIINKRFVKQ